MTHDKQDRLFVAIYPAGISYADRSREEAGDFKRLAFLTFGTLELKIQPDCPADLRAQIEADAALIQARIGQQFKISTAGQTVTLGHALGKQSAN